MRFALFYDSLTSCNKVNKILIRLLDLPETYVPLVTRILLRKFNPFVPNAPFLYPLKTSENR